MSFRDFHTVRFTICVYCCRNGKLRMKYQTGDSQTMSGVESPGKPTTEGLVRAGCLVARKIRILWKLPFPRMEIRPLVRERKGENRNSESSERNNHGHKVSKTPALSSRIISISLHQDGKVERKAFSVRETIYLTHTTTKSGLLSFFGRRHYPARTFLRTLYVHCLARYDPISFCAMFGMNICMQCFSREKNGK